VDGAAGCGQRCPNGQPAAFASPEELDVDPLEEAVEEGFEEDSVDGFADEPPSEGEDEEDAPLLAPARLSVR
jgi:hypothetical protein